MKLTKELILSILCGLLTISMFVMCLFGVKLGVFICISLGFITFVGLFISFIKNYQMDFLGIVLLILGIYIIVTQIIFLLSFNGFIWAHKILVVMFNILLLCFALITYGAPYTKIMWESIDATTESACILCFMVVFIILFIINLKQYQTKNDTEVEQNMEKEE